jgi:hypothetical protein
MRAAKVACEPQDEVLAVSDEDSDRATNGPKVEGTVYEARRYLAR